MVNKKEECHNIFKRKEDLPRVPKSIQGKNKAVKCRSLTRKQEGLKKGKRPTYVGPEVVP